MQKSHLDQIAIRKISRHNCVPIELVTSVESMAFSALGKKTFSPEAVQKMTRFHPLHVVEGDDESYSCFAGLRMFYLCQIFLPPDSTVTAHINTPPPTAHEMIELALIDTFASSLAYSLDEQVWDFDIARLWNQLPDSLKEEVTPEIMSKLRLAEFLGVNRRRLSQNATPPQSKLKNTLQQDDPSS